MTLVPVLFQKLVGMHGVDAARLRAEMTGKIKTRTWPGSAHDRRDLTTLPDRFPRFKGVVVGGVLRIEALRLTEDATFSATARHTRLDMPRPALPESLLAALEGRRLADVVDHPSIDSVTTVTGVREQTADNGSPRLVLELDMHRVPLTSTSAPAAMAVRQGNAAPDLHALAALTHVAAGGRRLAEAALVDPRTWRDAIGWDWSMVGLRNEASTTDGEHVVAVRFPYDRRMATALGRAGAGAWFDRETYSWRIDPGPDQLARLSLFLAEHADVVIGPDGTLYAPNQD